MRIIILIYFFRACIFPHRSVLIGQRIYYMFLTDITFIFLVFNLKLFFIIVIFILWRKTKSGRTDILLTGLSDSGKTCLFSQMLFNEDRETFSSVTTNIGELSTEKVSVCVYCHQSNHALTATYIPTTQTRSRGVPRHDELTYKQVKLYSDN